MGSSQFVARIKVLPRAALSVVIEGRTHWPAARCFEDVCMGKLRNALLQHSSSSGPAEGQACMWLPIENGVKVERGVNRTGERPDGINGSVLPIPLGIGGHKNYPAQCFYVVKFLDRHDD